MNVREIEQIIDHIHENHPVFKKEKKQLLYELLSSLEDISRLIVIASILNRSMLTQIIKKKNLNANMKIKHIIKGMFQTFKHIKLIQLTLKKISRWTPKQ